MKRTLFLYKICDIMDRDIIFLRYIQVSVGHCYLDNNVKWCFEKLFIHLEVSAPLVLTAT